MKRLLIQINNIIEPNNENKMSRFYDWVMLVAIVIGIFPLMFRTHYKLFWYFDLISCLCFIVDYVLRWVTSVLRSERHSWLAIICYPFTPMAIIDLLSILMVRSFLDCARTLARRAQQDPLSIMMVSPSSTRSAARRAIFIFSS